MESKRPSVPPVRGPSGSNKSARRSDSLVPPPLPRGTDPDDHTKWLVGIGVLLATLALLLLIFLLFRAPSGEGDGQGDLPGQGGGGGDSSIVGAGSGEGADSVNNFAGSEAVDEQVDGDPVEDQNDLVSTPPTEAPGDIPSLQDTLEEPRVPEADSSQEDGEATDITEQAAISPRRSNSFYTLGRQEDSSVRSPLQDPPRRSSRTRGNDLAGRQAGNKGDLLRDFGGTGVTEAAVKLGLEWLARNQQSDGLWSLRGPYSDASGIEDRAVASAMALLAFQGAGHTPMGDDRDPFTQVVAQGWKGLLDHIDSGGVQGVHGGHRGGYTEAICTIALCELYAMTKKPRYKPFAKKAVDYCLEAQSPQGGWRYVPRTDSDTSVTGWYVMALQSARMGGFKVNQNVFGRVEGYLDQAASHDGERYAYTPGTPATHSMTAEGLLCRQYLGWEHDDPRLLAGTDFLLQRLPDWSSRDVYYWYYATQVTHHMGGKPWKTWNNVMRDLLPAKQVQEGPEKGSWHPRGDKYGSTGGRLYVTCMSIYILEVYYRYLPLYQEQAVGTGR